MGHLQSEYIVKLTTDAEQIIKAGIGGKRIRIVDWAVCIDGSAGVAGIVTFFFGENYASGYPVASVNLGGGFGDFWSSRILSSASQVLTGYGISPYSPRELIGDDGESAGLILTGGNVPAAGSFVKYELVDVVV